jgi:hypothetical protein
VLLVHTQISADAQLDSVRAVLAQHGLHVTGPYSTAPGPGEPQAASIGVSDPVSGRYAEVSLVRHTPDPGTWYLQLSFWEDAAHDPAGLDMASRVIRLLSGPGDHDAAAGSPPAPAQETAQ